VGTKIPELKGKVAVVTGASRGIGRSIAIELAKRGANIAFNYFRNRDAARETESTLAQIGVRVVKTQAHLAEPETAERLIEQVWSEFGQLDILVNNAASGVMRPQSELDPKHWNWTLDINARAPWLCAKAASARMKQGGRIVNISSPGSMKVLPDYFSVGISKAALEAVTRYLAIDLGKQGISVNTVSAGFVETDALKAFKEVEQIQNIARRPTPAGRPVTANDVAKVVAWLCGDGGEMIRGQVILVDGGETLLHR